MNLSEYGPVAQAKKRSPFLPGSAQGRFAAANFLDGDFRTRATSASRILQEASGPSADGGVKPDSDRQFKTLLINFVTPLRATLLVRYAETKFFVEMPRCT